MKTLGLFPRLVVFLFFCLFRFFSFGAEHYFYKQITLDAGLPTTLTCIFADTRGFIWTGTKAGLGRFDGHDQKRYINRRNDITSLPGNHIYQIIEDRHHNLWILTDMGVALYNYRYNNFTTLTDEQGGPCVAYSVCLWKDELLFGGKNIVYIYDKKTNRLKKRYELKLEEDFEIARIAAIAPGTLLCCSRWNGICAINMQNGTLVNSPFGPEKEITDMFIDSEQRIWIAPYNQGLRCFSVSGKEIASYTTRNSAIKSNIVICITERQGQIWIGTDGGGINILDPKSNRFTYLEHSTGDKLYSLPTNSINSLHCDYYHNIWVGGVYNGLIGIRPVSMKTYTDVQQGNRLGLSHSIVLSIHKESPDRIWIGTDGGGMNSYNPRTELFTYYPTTGRDKITSICEFGPGKLLLSIFAEGLFVFDTHTGTKTPFGVIDEKTTMTLSKHGYSVYLYRNTPHTILILSDHVYIYDLKKKTFSIAAEEEKQLINWGTLQSVTNDGEQTFLFDNKRIYALNHKTQSLKVLFTCSSEMQINSVDRDFQGNFWIGSNLGLSCYVSHAGRLETTQTSLFGAVSLVMCGPKGEVWIGAENRLFAYLQAENRFILFGESDGAIPNEYLPRPKIVTDNNDIYIGGVKGLLHISKGWNPEVSTLPELQLSDILLNGQSTNSRLEKKQEVLTVPFNSNITIQIMSKEEDIFRQKLYRYRIEGLDNNYMESYSTELVMRALHPGNYKIMASCTTKDGSWMPDRQILEVTVLPPWYRTWWAVGGGLFLVVLSIIVSIRRVLKNKERKLKWSMKEHEQQVYEEKVRFLINISHELRTPLTLIYAPLKRMLKSLSAEDEQYLPLRAIYRQSQRMKALINMVLDLRKMEVGESRLHVRPCILNKWIEQVSQDFVSEGEAEQVRFVYNLDPQIETVYFDKDKCEIVLSNLLVNALKHSPQNSTITVASQLLTESNDVQVSVSDQGCGLQQVDMEKLFTRFYQGSNEQSGTGIGLSYSKILIEQHGGILGVRSNYGEGATFYFRLPMRLDAEEIVCRPGAYLNELVEEEENILPLKTDEFELSAYSVLVVDDHPDMTDFLKKSLKEFFKQVITAADGVEALQLMKTHAPDVIVSDVMMPRMNGYQLCMEIKKNVDVSHIPVILLTARHDEQSQKDGYKNGADAYLMKPFEVDTLIELIHNRLKARDAIRKRYMSIGSLPVPEEATFSQADENFLFRLNRFIEENLGNSELDISFICKEMGMSRASLYNKLKVLTDMSANEYINKFRMERAILLIHSTDMIFSDIAEKVGFTTSSYFSTAFKQYTGETPTQYKKKIRQ